MGALDYAVAIWQLYGVKGFIHCEDEVKAIYSRINEMTMCLPTSRMPTCHCSILVRYSDSTSTLRQHEDKSRRISFD